MVERNGIVPNQMETKKPHFSVRFELNINFYSGSFILKVSIKAVV